MNVNWHFVCPACILAWLAAGICVSASGTTITWTNTAGGSWNLTNNWSPNQIPGASDTALITTSGNYTVTLNVAGQVSTLVVGGASGTQNLTVTGNTLTATNGTIATNGILNLSNSALAGLLTVNGTLNYTNGSTLAAGAAVTIASNAVMNISGSATGSFYSALINAGTVTWSGTGNLQFYNNGGGNTGGLVNQPGALFNVQNDQTMLNNSGSAYFNNAGTFEKLTGTNTTIGLLFTNTGVMNVASGMVTLNGGGVDTGTITGPGSVAITANTLTVNAMVPNLVLAGGTVIGASAIITNLTWNSGTLQGTNTVTALAVWTNGTLNPSSELVIASNAVLNLGGSVGESLFGALINAGTVTWSGTGNLQFYNNGGGNTGGLVNQPGALFNVQNDQTMLNNSGSAYFNNAGTFEKLTGTNTTIGLLFTNTGVMNVASGMVTLNGGGVDTGTITGPGSVAITADTLTVNAVVPYLVLAGGTVNGASAVITNLTWNSGTLQGTNTVTALAVWTNGTLNPSSELVIASNAVLNLGGSVLAKAFSAR